ncbi:MAG: hypothetical protein H6988_11585 [Pseudomonadales bacterium]|nr:hypothetical protein [Pseudomonadales bacterium]
MELSISELMGLPAIQAAIREKTEANLKAAAAARVAVLKEIEQLSADLEKVEGELSGHKAKADKVRAELDAAMRAVRGAEQRKVPVLQALAAARKRLRREFGEDSVDHAVAVLTSRLRSADAELQRAEQLAAGKTVLMGRAPRDEATSTAKALLADAKLGRELVRDALGRVQQLQGSKLSPSEIRHQVKTILGAVLDMPDE